MSTHSGTVKILYWARLAPAERRYTASVSENPRRLYVQVRASKGAAPVEFAVEVADLPKPPAGVDDDVEIMLEGDRCPKLAG